jgi:perosamine synthetase
MCYDFGIMIPLYKPYIGKKETEAVRRVFKSGKLARGKEVEKFEKEFAAYVGKKYAVALNSGTSGLHVAIRTMNWKVGDEVITTPFSYVASSNALLFENIKPVFVDIDPKTLNIDTNKIEEKITKKTKGILLVHILGLPVDLKKIKELKKKYNLQIIEDACEAVGRPSNDFEVAKIGEISVYGFHENKQLTAGGEGGMIVTDDPLLARKCASIRDQGRSTKKNWLDNVILGFNFRMTEMQAAFGAAQLESMDKILEKREKIAQKYSSFLKNVRGVTVPQNLNGGKRSWFVYFILFDEPSDRKIVQGALSAAGIGSSTNYFPPIYKFPMYKNYRTGNFQNTESASEKLLVLPIFYEMTDKQIAEVCGIIKKSLRR